jgi:hypothetical protein
VAIEGPAIEAALVLPMEGGHDAPMTIAHSTAMSPRSEPRDIRRLESSGYGVSRKGLIGLYRAGA